MPPKMCNQPDRDVPKIKCGYPLPCPYHTVVVEEGYVKVPEKAKIGRRELQKLHEIAKVIKKGGSP